MPDEEEPQVRGSVVVQSVLFPQGDPAKHEEPLSVVTTVLNCCLKESSHPAHAVFKHESVVSPQSDPPLPEVEHVVMAAVSQDHTTSSAANKTRQRYTKLSDNFLVPDEEPQVRGSAAVQSVLFPHREPVEHDEPLSAVTTVLNCCLKESSHPAHAVFKQESVVSPQSDPPLPEVEQAVMASVSQDPTSTAPSKNTQRYKAFKQAIAARDDRWVRSDLLRE